MSKLRDALILARPFVEAAWESAVWISNPTASKLKEKLAIIDAALAEETPPPPPPRDPEPFKRN